MKQPTKKQPKIERLIVSEFDGEFFVGLPPKRNEFSVFAVRHVKHADVPRIKLGAVFLYRWLGPNQQEFEFTGETMATKPTKLFEQWGRL